MKISWQVLDVCEQTFPFFLLLLLLFFRSFISFNSFSTHFAGDVVGVAAVPGESTLCISKNDADAKLNTI